MKRLSRLEHFLREQRADGQSRDSGSFTLAREVAVRKLAEFQLPFAGAWIVKVVQSLVASGLQSPIQVEQSQRVTTVRFAGGLPWDLAELESALINPEPHASRAINHIVAALRVVGMNDKRSFDLCLAGAREALLWDGARLHNVSRKPTQEMTLTVTHSSPLTSTAWLYDQVEAARRNAEVVAALRDYCFTCPRPLCVDKRRVDGLQRCPNHGWNQQSFPLTLSFLEGGLAPQEWPSGTFEQRRFSDPLSDGGGFEEFSRALFSRREPPPQSEMAVMLTAHPKSHSETPPGSKWPVTVWSLGREPSRCHWILDGATIQVDELPVTGGVSAALFLSAEGLQTDLSGFSLLDGKELRQRRKTACDLAQGPVRALISLSKAPLTSHNARRYAWASNVLLVGSIGLGWYLSPIGLGWVAVPFGGVAFLVRFAERLGQDSLLADLGSSSTDLVRNWKSLCSENPLAPSPGSSPGSKKRRTKRWRDGKRKSS